MNLLTNPEVSLSERSLGAMEKLFYLLNESHPNHFAMVGEVTGPTRIDQWQDGLDQVAKRSPLAWSRIELDSHGVPVFRPAPPGSMPLKVAPYDASQWTAEVAAQIAEPFDELQPPKELRRPDGSAPHVRALRLSAEMTHKLRVRARAERTSVQSSLVAALVGATFRLAPEMCEEPMRIVSPVDLRRRLLDHSDHLGMCVSGVVLADDGPRDADLWSRARHLGQAFEGIQSETAFAATVLGQHSMLAHVNTADEAKAVFADVFANEAAVTNLGVVDLPRTFGPLVLDAVWGPSVSVGFVGEQVIGATTFRDRLHLVYTSYAPIVGLIDQMEAEMTAALTNVN